MHNFHIPVMGLSYTIDSPIRVAQFGINSVVSIIDDDIIEKMRSFYSKKFNFDYSEISTKIEDFRAKRITSYLDLLDDIVQLKFQNFKEDLCNKTEALINFFDILPETSSLKNELQNIVNKIDDGQENLKRIIENYLNPGAIDVNIMSKIDKTNFNKNIELPTIHNDAHTSLRGFANSKLTSSVIFSAGMNPRLYSYIEEFEDFYPDSNNKIKKKIILKVSDYRSALIQGNFLAKKGLWVSEYRIESGLNCGGHAFATEGLLLGPVMEEFKNKKDELYASAFSLMNNALEKKGKRKIVEPLEMNISVQGGIGTSEEHHFILSNYNVNSIGWGSPFLLVPEATSVDPETRDLLIKAKPEDFYLSDISPLGVPFNAIKGTSNEIIKNEKIANNTFGSSCPKRLLALNNEFSEKGLCTASRKYQEEKLRELEARKHYYPEEIFNKLRNKILSKSCLCVGLANSCYIEQGLQIKGEKQGVVICPGPNLSFFKKEVSLFDMIKHIYGSTDILNNNERPNVFINELKLYVDYLTKEVTEFSEEITKNQIKKWITFKNNLLKGISYYEELFQSTNYFKNDFNKMNQQLNNLKNNIQSIVIPLQTE